jgi:predicted pyridoxine 5'-phosphate oxidase superfamily flavin-nucleotide-binding protein
VGILTEDMKRVVREQRLGFVATVSPDGTPNLSPKGTTTVLDDDHLVFADIRSPGTVANVRQNPSMEINVVDPISRKGYRFKGTAQVLTEGSRFDELRDLFDRERGGDTGLGSRIRSVVVVAVEWAAPLVSPAYDSGATEEEVRAEWRAYYDGIEKARR